MPEPPAFELWLEFEVWEPKPDDDDPEDEFAIVGVRLPLAEEKMCPEWLCSPEEQDE